MKQFKQFIFISFLTLIVFVIAPFVRAYEPDQLTDCISSALINPALEGVSESSIQNYCECALDLIVDQQQDVRDSGYKCAVKSFGANEG